MWMPRALGKHQAPTCLSVPTCWSLPKSRCSLCSGDPWTQPPDLFRLCGPGQGQQYPEGTTSLPGPCWNLAHWSLAVTWVGVLLLRGV